MVDLARETLKGDVRRFMFDRIKDHLGNSLNEAQQRKLVEDLDRQAADLVERSIGIVAGAGGEVVKWEFKQPTHKVNSDGSYIEAKVRAPFTGETWMACGLASHMLSTMLCPADLYGEREKMSALIRPDQGDLYTEEPPKDHEPERDGPTEAEIAAATEMSDAEKIKATMAIMVIPGPILKGGREFAWEHMNDDTYKGARWGWAAAMCDLSEAQAKIAWEEATGSKPTAPVTKAIKLGHNGRVAYVARRDKGDLPGSQKANADGEMPAIPEFLRRSNQIDTQAIKVDAAEGDAPPVPAEPPDDDLDMADDDLDMVDD